jgi:hypothetical protein
MAQLKQQSVTEAPRSLYNQAGDLKSPQFRGAEIKGANVDAKAQRFAQALHDADVTSTDVRNIPVGRLSINQIQQGGMPGWGNVVDDLVSKGVLKPDEMPPNESLPKIIGYLKKLESQKIARDLADEMKRSGTIQ